MQTFRKIFFQKNAVFSHFFQRKAAFFQKSALFCLADEKKQAREDAAPKALRRRNGRGFFAITPQTVSKKSKKRRAGRTLFRLVGSRRFFSFHAAFLRRKNKI